MVSLSMMGGLVVSRRISSCFLCSSVWPDVRVGKLFLGEPRGEQLPRQSRESKTLRNTFVDYRCVAEQSTARLFNWRPGGKIRPAGELFAPPVGSVLKKTRF